MDNVKQRLASGAVWLGAARVLINLIALASSLLLARLLTPSDFGLVAIATTVAAIVFSFTELSLSLALVHHKDPQRDHFDTALTLNLIRAAFLAALISAIAYPVAQFYRDERLVPILLLISGTTLIGGFANPKLVVFARNLVFWQEFILSASQKLVGFAVAMTVAIMFRSYWALVLGAAAAQLSALAISYVLIPYRPRFRLKEARGLLSFSVWVSMGQAIGTLNWRFDQLVIGYFLGRAPLGYYTVAENLAVLPTREAGGPLIQILFPGFAKLTHDAPRLRAAFRRSQALLYAILLPAGVGLALVAEPLVQLAMGDKWLPAAMIIQFLASAFAVASITLPLQPVALAMGRTKLIFQRDLVLFLIKLPMIAAGLLLGGLVGVVYARCAFSLVATAVNMSMVRRLIDVPITTQLMMNARSLISVAVMAGGVYAVGRTSLLAAPMGLPLRIIGAVALGASLYVGARYLLWFLAGRPDGPERDVHGLVAGFLRGRGLNQTGG